MPTSEEREWYEMLWGKHAANVRFISYYESVKVKERDTKKKGYRKVSADIESEYKPLAEHFEKLNKQYSNIIQKYPLVSNMLMNIVFPEFLRNLINNNEI
jgi:hypothetical protein